MHILIEGKLSGPGRRCKGIEIYDYGRYFTSPGSSCWRVHAPLKGDSTNWTSVIKEFCANREISLGLESAGEPYVCASDEELIQRAKTATNGQRFSRLWAGDTSDFEETTAERTWRCAECFLSGVGVTSSVWTGCSVVPGSCARSGTDLLAASVTASGRCWPSHPGGVDQPASTFIGTIGSLLHAADIRKSNSTCCEVDQAMSAKFVARATSAAIRFKS